MEDGQEYDQLRVSANSSSPSSLKTPHMGPLWLPEAVTHEAFLCRIKRSVQGLSPMPSLFITK